MNIFEAIILGFVQGAAEFLPISSSGHLAIFKTFFGLKDVGLTFDLMLHLGTLLAVFVVYWSDIWKLIKEGFGIVFDAFRNVIKFFEKRFGVSDVKYIKIVRTSYRKFVMMVIVSSIPTAIIGLTFEKIFNFDNPVLFVPGISLLITSVLLSFVDVVPVGNKTPKNATYKNAAIVGISQGFATLPGLSRSGTTLTVALFNGFDRSFAVKYSFIMSIPAILGANILHIPDLFKAENTITSTELVNYFIGTAVAAVVGFICIKTMLVLVKNKKMKYFSYYCFVMGIIAIIAGFIM